MSFQSITSLPPTTVGTHHFITMLTTAAKGRERRGRGGGREMGKQKKGKQGRGGGTGRGGVRGKQGIVCLACY